MNVRNCRKCGKIFNYIVGAVMCPRCKEEMEKKFQEAKKFVQENRGATIAIVAEEVGVEPQQVRQWVREERLEFSDDSLIGIACEKCGATIKSGRFCEKCKGEMVGAFKNAIGDNGKKALNHDDKGSDRDNPKMRFL